MFKILNERLQLNSIIRLISIQIIRDEKSRGLTFESWDDLVHEGIIIDKLIGASLHSPPKQLYLFLLQILFTDLLVDNLQIGHGYCALIGDINGLKDVPQIN